MVSVPQVEEPDVPDFIQGLVALLQSYGMDLEESQGMIRDMVAETWPLLAHIRLLFEPSPSQAVH